MVDANRRLVLSVLDLPDTDFDFVPGHPPLALHPSPSFFPLGFARLYLCVFSVPENRRWCQKGLVKLSCWEWKAPGPEESD